jgi:hypothetical protein
MKKSSLIRLSSVALSFFSLVVMGYSQEPNSKETEITGYYVIKPNDRSRPDVQGETRTHMLMDRETGTGTVLDISGLEKTKLRTGREFTVRGSLQESNVGLENGQRSRNVFRATSIRLAETESVSGEPATDDVSSSSQETATSPEPVPPTVTEFKCLLLFANTSDYTVNATKKAASENFLFGSGGNVSDWFFDATYGHYRLTFGDSVILDMTSETAAGTDSETMYYAMLNKAESLGYDVYTDAPNEHQRVLFFMPNGVTEGGTANWTAWAWIDSIGGAWCHSVYSYNWTGAFFDGHAHEMCHNFGFEHSSEGGAEYGDETCVMAFSHSGSSKTAISTLNPVKKAQLGVFDAYPGSKVDLSSDSTLDMYPLAISPTNQAGVRCVTISGTDYYISYRRDIAPYGKIWNNDSAKIDKIIVYTNTGFDNRSFLAGYINEGGTYSAGGIPVKFERYGNGDKDYATVSFDLDDGNTKPVATGQSVNADTDVAKSITLTGSDSDGGDVLTYSIYTAPTNGTIGGTGKNITYTSDPGYEGGDSFVFEVSDGKISSFATVTVDVTAPSMNVSVVATDATADETDAETGYWTITRVGDTVDPLDVYFSLSGSATLTNDYSISISSPVTIPSGQITTNVTLTPVDDDVYGEGLESVVLTITPDADYVIIAGTGTITIADNDFVAPNVSNSTTVPTSVTSADLSGLLTTGGASDAWICWGVADGETANTGDWENVEHIGTVNAGMPFSTNVAGLATNATYWFRCYVTNQAGTAWSLLASSFSGEAVGKGGAWTPAQITTIAWYDAADAGTVQLNAGAVSNWMDKSGSNYHMKQPSGSKQPIYNASDSLFGGLPSISGTANINRYLEMDQTIEIKRLYMVVYYGDGTDTVFSKHDALLGDATGNWRLCGRDGDNHVFDGTRDVKNFDNGGTTYRNGSTVDTTYQANGLPITGEIFTLTSPLVRTGQWRLLGNNANWTGWGGGLGEMIFTDGSEDLATQQMIEGYLAHKWGMESTLAAGHPYETAPPGGSGPIANASPSGVLYDAASLNATLDASGTNYDVYVYYGPIDGQSNAALWTHGDYVDTWTDVITNISYVAQGLGMEENYYYTFAASTDNGVAWASPSWRFDTLGVGTVTSNGSVPIIWLESMASNWLEPLDIVVTSDADGDGFTTAQEFYAGTDPQNSSSYLCIADMTMTGANVDLEWNHAVVGPGVPPLAIQRTTNLTSGVWESIGSYSPTNGVNVWRVDLPGAFYRLAVTNMP